MSTSALLCHHESLVHLGSGRCIPANRCGVPYSFIRSHEEPFIRYLIHEFANMSISSKVPAEKKPESKAKYSIFRKVSRFIGLE